MMSAEISELWQLDEAYIVELEQQIAELEEDLDAYEVDHTICDYCGCLTLDPVDCGDHMQCKSCTKIGEALIRADAAETKLYEIAKYLFSTKDAFWERVEFVESILASPLEGEDS
jgi:hypothetical protein